MAYEGYHVKFGDKVYPEKYCCNYKCTPDRRTDKSSSITSSGKLKRKILPHKRSGATWNTGYITDKDIPKLQQIFEDRDSISCKFWNPAKLGYTDGTVYLPDIEFEVLKVENGINYYRPITLEVIEY